MVVSSDGGGLVSGPATPKQVAELLGVGRAKVCQWINSGRLRAIDLSGESSKLPRFRILPGQLAEFLSASEVHPPQAKARKKPSKTVEPRQIKEFV